MKELPPEERAPRETEWSKRVSEKEITDALKQLEEPPKPKRADEQARAERQELREKQKGRWVQEHKELNQSHQAELKSLHYSQAARRQTIERRRQREDEGPHTIREKFNYAVNLLNRGRGERQRYERQQARQEEDLQVFNKERSEAGTLENKQLTQRTELTEKLHKAEEQEREVLETKLTKEKPPVWKERETERRSQRESELWGKLDERRAEMQAQKQQTREPVRTHTPEPEFNP